jgi:hypothetical protein
MTMTRLGSVTLAAVALLLVSADHAHAYLDPGLGSMLLQGLVAGVAAGSVVLSRYWHRIKTLFSSNGSRERKRESPDSAQK